MAQGIKQIAANLVPAVALDPVDSLWEQTLSGSLIYRFWSWLKLRAGSFHQPLLEKAGDWMLTGSVPVVLALLVALALPQFASDKEGLALFVVIALALRILGALLSGQSAHRANAVDMLVVAYLLINVIATAASHYPIPSLKGLAKLCIYTSAYFVFVGTLAGSRRRILLALSTTVAIGLAVALYGLYQYKVGVAPLATWEDPTVDVQATRIYSTLGNPNLLAGYLVPLTPVCFSLGLVFAASRKWWLCIPAIAGGGVFMLATVLTGSRGGYIGLLSAMLALAAVSGAWLWQCRPKARPLVVLLVLSVPVLLAVIVHGVPAFEQRVSSLFAGWQHSSNAFRLNVWRASWAMFLDNWWIGVGPGNQAFRLAYGLYMRSGFDALGTYCVPLEVAVECGIPGLLAAAMLLLSVLARAHEAFWQSADLESRWLVAGAISAIVGIMAHGAVDTVFYRPQVHFLFWLLVAVVVTLHDIRDKSP